VRESRTERIEQLAVKEDLKPDRTTYRRLDGVNERTELRRSYRRSRKIHWILGTDKTRKALNQDGEEDGLEWSEHAERGQRLNTRRG
jgi:hypothetical protein